MMAMALAAAVTMSSVPVVAFAEDGVDSAPTQVSAPAPTNPDTPVKTETSGSTVTSGNTSEATTQTNTSWSETNGNQSTSYEGSEIKVTVTKNEPAADDSSDASESTVLSQSTTTDNTLTTTTQNADGSSTVVKENVQTENSQTATESVQSDVETTVESDYDADGDWVETDGVQQGEETKTEVKEGKDVTIPVIGENATPDGKTEDGKDIFVGSDGEASEPVVEGDVPEGENDTEWNYTETTETPREVEVIVGGVIVQTGSSELIDENGEPVNREDEGFNYYWSEIYNVDGKSIIDGEASNWTTGRVKAMLIDANGTEQQIHAEGVCQRVVAHDNGTPDDYSDDYEVGGLYCTDMSTGIKQDLKYRRANLEDADYYTTEEAEHLRAIMTYGYTWNDDTDDNEVMGDQNLESMKTMLKDAAANGDETTKALLAGIDFDALTREQAATATGMAVWHYGNRVILEEGQSIELRSRDGNAETAARIEAVYKYLITLKESATNEDGSYKETQVINEEKFVEEMETTIGSMVKDHENNQDADHDNDVYEVGLKFSLVVTPDKENDDLIVKVLDNNGNEVKSARIAGNAAEGEEFLDLGEDGSYTMTGLKLQENSDTTFNLKLEGYQLLEEGVYVFESQHLDKDDWVDRRIEYMKDNGAWESELAASGMTVEEYKAFLGTKYEENPSLGESQNFIGKYSAEAEVDVSMEIDLNFNVEEGTVQQKHSWRRTWHNEPSNNGNNNKEEETKTPEDPTSPGNPGGSKEDDGMVLGAEDEIVAEEEGMVAGAEENIADAEDEGLVAGAEDEIIAATADSNHMAGAGASMFAALAGLFMLGRKKKTN